MFTGFPVTFINTMNVSITRKLTERELGAAVKDMAKEQIPSHDGIHVEFFQRLWPTIGKDFHLMILRGIKSRNFCEEVTKGLISLIPKERDARDLNH